MSSKSEKKPIPSTCIQCPHCGEQIPMEPKLSDMVQAIESHLLTHKDHHHNHNFNLDPIQHPKAPSISEDLAEQVLIRAAEIGESLSKEPNLAMNFENQGKLHSFSA